MGEFSQFALRPEQGAVPTMEQLSPDMQDRIAAMAQRLDLRDSAAVLAFGAKTQKDMDAFTSLALSRMSESDIEPMDGTLAQLAEQIKSCSFGQEAKGLFRRMFGGATPLAEVREAYERAMPRINECADELTDRRVALLRDSALLDRIYERNETLYRELCSLIVVGDEAIRQAKARGENPQLVARLERRVQDLRVTQVASTQLAAQIRMVQESDKLAAERLRAALDVTIPLWKSQMAAALGLARATDSLAASRKVSAEAERGIRMGARLTEEQKRSFAKEAQSTDTAKASETAEKLLAELTEIERSLQNQQKARQNGQSAVSER